MKEHINLINYTKPKAFQIKDKESANLKRIKKCLYPPSIEDLINIQKENVNNNESDITSFQNKTFLNNNKKINRNSSMINIKSNININKINNQSKNNDENIINDLYNINVNGKDTLEVLNNLVNQEKYLSERMDKKLEKINSLIEVKLPYPKNYPLIIHYCKNKQILKDKNKKNFSFYPSPNKNYNTHINFKKKRDLPEFSPIIRKKISYIKDDIKNKTNEQINNYLGYLGYQTVNHINGFININNNKGI